MTLKKVWLSPDTAQKSRYGFRTLGGIAGITALMVLLIVGGTFLSFYLNLPREIFSVMLVCGVTVLAAVLGLKLGWRGVQDATVFFLTEDDRLFVMDARTLSNHGRGILGYAMGTMETQKFLRELADQPFVPAGADEILKVEQFKECRTYYAVRCQARRPNRQVLKRTYFLVKGYEDEELLLRHLERRQNWKTALESTENHNPLYILLSTLVFGGFTVLCVLSHPVLGKLPQSIYFPCLGAAFIAIFFVVYFIIRQRRGE